MKELNEYAVKDSDLTPGLDIAIKRLHEELKTTMAETDSFKKELEADMKKYGLTYENL